MIKKVDGTMYLVTVTYNGDFEKTWLSSVFPLNVGDYISLPYYIPRTKKRGDVQAKIVKIWESKPTIMDINIQK